MAEALLRSRSLLEACARLVDGDGRERLAESGAELVTFLPRLEEEEALRCGLGGATGSLELRREEDVAEDRLTSRVPGRNDEADARGVRLSLLDRGEAEGARLATTRACWSLFEARLLPLNPLGLSGCDRERETIAGEPVVRGADCESREPSREACGRREFPEEEMRSRLPEAVRDFVS